MSKWCFCFLICCLGLSYLFFQEVKVFYTDSCSCHLQWFLNPRKWNLLVSILFPIYLPWMVGPDAMILVFWILSFKPNFSLSSFIFIKRFLSSSLLSALRMVSPVYLYFLWLSWFQSVLQPARHFAMMYSTYKLKEQGNNIQPWCISLPNLEPVLCSMSGSNYCFLFCIQVSQEAGKVFWYF